MSEKIEQQAGGLPDGPVPLSEWQEMERALAAARAELEQLAETHRMQLVAISVLALCNTLETAQTHRIGEGNPYWTAALHDVYSAVDREITHRERAAALYKALNDLVAAVELEHDANMPAEIRDAYTAAYAVLVEQPKEPVGQPSGEKRPENAPEGLQREMGRP